MPEFLKEDIEKATKNNEFKIWYLDKNNRDVIIDFPFITRWVFEYKNRNNKHYINDWVISTFGSVEDMLLFLEIKNV